MKRVEQELVNAKAYGREVNEKLLQELEVSSRLLTHVYCVAHLGWLETLTGSSPKQYQKIEEVKQNDYLRNSLGPLPTASGKTNARKAPDPRDIVMSYFARFRHNLSREWVAKVSGLSRNVFTKNLFICGLLPGGQVRELPAAGRRDLGQRRQDQGPAGRLKYGIVIDGTHISTNTPANPGLANRAYSSMITLCVSDSLWW